MLQQVRFFDSEKDKRYFADATKLHKIADARAFLLRFPDLTKHRTQLAESKIELRYQGKVLNDTDLIPRPPRETIVELEFRVFKPTFQFRFGSTEKLFHFDDGLPVGAALRRLAAHLRVPAPVLSVEAGGHPLRETDPLSPSLSPLVVRTPGFLNLSVKFGGSTAAYFLPSTATVRDLHSIVWCNS
jgi:hypothetical protein